MKIQRMLLCYENMEKIIVDKEKDLARYDLSQVTGIDVTVSMSLDEFNRLRAMNQFFTGTTSNSVCMQEDAGH